MVNRITFLLASLCLAGNVLPLEAISSVFKRHSLIFHEPPVKNIQQFDNRVTEHYITQRLDNFNHQDSHTFQMRYLMNDVHFKSGGPIFIFIGGEWEIGPSHISPGLLIYDIAKEHSGLLIYTEHRYYGRSFPTNTTTENLKYLSVEQSLADLAHFVREITADKELNATGGVIVVGGSYSATMAAWFRQKYPHLVKGAWASSAPLQAKVNYFEYTETVGKSIRTIGGEKCYQAIEETFKAIDELIDNEDTSTLKTVFKLCDDFDASKVFDVHNFARFAMAPFAGLVQTYSPGRLDEYCDSFSDANTKNHIGSRELDVFSKLFQNTYLQSGADCILADYTSSIKELQKTNSTGAMRSWYYQTCSEFGWYQTTDSEKQPFGSNSPIAFNFAMCQDMFGPHIFTNSSIESNIKHTNDMYGGIDSSVTNVYFTHGSLDPWHRMGVLSDLNEHSLSTVIPGVSHCKDLDAIDYTYDSKELINSKVTIMNLVKKWLKY